MSDPTGLGWWAYGTHQNGCGGYCFSQWYDYSALFAKEIAKEVAKIERLGQLGEKITALAAALATLVAAIIHNHTVAVIVVASVTVVLVTIGITVRKWIGLVSRLFRRNTGKHTKLNGFYQGYHHNFFTGYSFAGDHPRGCHGEKLRCGSGTSIDWRPKDGTPH